MEKQAAISSAVSAVALASNRKSSARSATDSKRVAFLSDLPDDVILKCKVLSILSVRIHSVIVPPGLSLLPPKCLCVVAEACKRLRTIASADNLWQPLSLRMWNQLQPQPPQTFKQVQFSLNSLFSVILGFTPCRCTESCGANGASRWDGWNGRVQWVIHHPSAEKFTRGKL
jgi:hypothetical protein